jgi:hypothetical protein
MTTAPILLDDSAGCRGLLRIDGRLLGLCVACDRHGKDTRNNIKPEAKRLSGGDWFCPNRRNSAGHVNDCAPQIVGGKSLTVGTAFVGVAI